MGKMSMQSRLHTEHDCIHECRAVELLEARCAGQATDCQCIHERRVVELPDARQVRLATDCQCIHKYRAAEWAEARLSPFAVKVWPHKTKFAQARPTIFYIPLVLSKA